MGRVNVWPEIIDLDELETKGTQTFPLAEYNGEQLYVTVAEENTEDTPAYRLTFGGHTETCGKNREDLDSALKKLADSITERDFIKAGGHTHSPALRYDVPSIDHLVGNIKFQNTLETLRDVLSPGETLRWQDFEIKMDDKLRVMKDGKELSAQELYSLPITKEMAQQFQDETGKLQRRDEQREASNRVEEGPGQEELDQDGQEGPGMERDALERPMRRMPAMQKEAPGTELPDAVKTHVNPHREDTNAGLEERRRREKEARRSKARSKLSRYSAERDSYRGLEIAGNIENSGSGSERYDDPREQADIMVHEAQEELER